MIRRAPFTGSGLLADADFVASRRALGASWAAIAGMIGRSEHDVRAAFDPTYEPDLSWLPATRDAVAEAQVVRQAQRPPVPTGPLGPMMIEALLAVARGAQTPAEIAAAVGRNVKQSNSLLHKLKRRGLLLGCLDGQRGRWTLTTAGQIEVSGEPQMERRA